MSQGTCAEELGCDSRRAKGSRAAELGDSRGVRRPLISETGRGPSPRRCRDGGCAPRHTPVHADWIYAAFHSIPRSQREDGACQSCGVGLPSLW